MFSKFPKFFLFKELNRNGLRFSSAAASKKEKNVAIVLSGCGVYDGTEITEAVSAMIHLSRHNAKISFFAPNIEQLHVINHATGEIEPQTRNVLHESARISRGSINSLNKLNGADFDALIVPGGFGAVKNLCDYAIDSRKYTINSEVERVFKEFIVGLKPIGLCCIAPVIAAKIFPDCTITVGKEDNDKKEWPYAGTIDNLKQIGASVVEKDINEIAVCDKYKIVTTPAFMKNASFYEVFSGIGLMVDQVMKICDQ